MASSSKSTLICIFSNLNRLKDFVDLLSKFLLTFSKNITEYMGWLAGGACLYSSYPDGKTIIRRQKNAYLWISMQGLWDSLWDLCFIHFRCWQGGLQEMWKQECRKTDFHIFKQVVRRFKQCPGRCTFRLLIKVRLLLSMTFWEPGWLLLHKGLLVCFNWQPYFFFLKM